MKKLIVLLLVLTLLLCSCGRAVDFLKEKIGEEDTTAEETSQNEEGVVEENSGISLDSISNQWFSDPGKSNNRLKKLSKGGNGKAILELARNYYRENNVVQLEGLFDQYAFEQWEGYGEGLSMLAAFNVDRAKELFIENEGEIEVVDRFNFFLALMTTEESEYAKDKIMELIEEENPSATEINTMVEKATSILNRDILEKLLEKTDKNIPAKAAFNNAEEMTMDMCSFKDEQGNWYNVISYATIEGDKIKVQNAKTGREVFQLEYKEASYMIRLEVVQIDGIENPCIAVSCNDYFENKEGVFIKIYSWTGKDLKEITELNHEELKIRGALLNGYKSAYTSERLGQTLVCDLKRGDFAENLSEFYDDIGRLIDVHTFSYPYVEYDSLGKCFKCDIVTSAMVITDDARASAVGISDIAVNWIDNRWVGQMSGKGGETMEYDEDTPEIEKTRNVNEEFINWVKESTVEKIVRVFGAPDSSFYYNGGMGLHYEDMIEIYFDGERPSGVTPLGKGLFLGKKIPWSKQDIYEVFPEAEAEMESEYSEMIIYANKGDDMIAFTDGGNGFYPMMFFKGFEE
ncbi:MAG: hypothetical protein GXZ11_02885 [Tissierellia bacterium]|nr:hypothetical protein [Tissierellia bacterium]